MAHGSSSATSSTPRSPQFTPPCWQKILSDTCRANSLPTPVFEIVSDRRGGRTAWSSWVKLSGKTCNARFWYDGKHLHNAKEDAAEVAVKHLNKQGYQSPRGSRW